MQPGCSLPRGEASASVVWNRGRRQKSAFPSCRSVSFLYGELVFDVNTAYFHNHGGYDFAKQFYTGAYKSAIEIVGGEQYILSAVMHADVYKRQAVTAPPLS